MIIKPITRTCGTAVFCRPTTLTKKPPPASTGCYVPKINRIANLNLNKMRIVLKVFLTIVALFIGIILLALSSSIKKHFGYDVSSLYINVIFIAIFAGVAAIWIYNPKRNKKSNSDLQKSHDDEKYKLDKTN